VTGVYNIIIGNLESSKYEIETGSAKLIESAEKGGAYGYNYYSEEGNILNVELGAPKEGLMTVWKNETGKNDSIQLFVPALFFPIVSSEVASSYGASVIVPLVGGMIDQNIIVPAVDIMRE
jgi:hypothetical protein